jgi:hypothetical protein
MPRFLHAEERAAWRQRIHVDLTDESFGQAALELYSWQYEACPPLRNLADMLGRPPAQVKSWREIPALPQRVFKETAVWCHGAEIPAHQFHTSGTTTGAPGVQRLLRVDLYLATVLEGALRAGLSTGGRELQFLAPPPREAPHSSLSFMFETWCERWGTERSSFWVRRNTFMLEGLRERLVTNVEEHVPVGLCGTAFAFVHYIDTFSRLDPIPLPRESWLLETGGFKGRSRELEKREFYQALFYLFDLPPEAIWNEYGMTELSSQAYAHGPNGIHCTPPWMRVVVVHPETGEEVAPGASGLVKVIDLANIDSCLAIQTLDVAVRAEGGFYLIGRLPAAEFRGCSLTSEDLRKE